MQDTPDPRSFRLKRSPSGRWTVERFVDGPGGGGMREISGTYSSREEAERAVLRYMRDESQRYKRDWHKRS